MCERYLALLKLIHQMNLASRTVQSPSVYNFCSEMVVQYDHDVSTVCIYGKGDEFQFMTVDFFQ